MPQGVAMSPDGTVLAVVEGGFNPPALRILGANNLVVRATIPLKGAFGKPVWVDERHVLVAGANTDALLEVDVQSGAVDVLPAGKGTWPTAVALSPDGKAAASANDMTGDVTVGALTQFGGAKTFAVGAHPSDVVFSRDGKVLYAASRGASTVSAIELASGAVTTIRVGLHPSALALSEDGTKLYVAESDDDSVGTIDLVRKVRTGSVDVGLHDGRLSGAGASPNALFERHGVVFATLGAENAIAVIHDGRVMERIPTGWYPDGIAIGSDDTLYVSDGKGESDRPNPQFNPFTKHREGYVAASQDGSVRSIPLGVYAAGNARNETAQVLANAMPTWTPPPASETVIRPDGPIRHVIYVIKENRTYDQVLGDLTRADGDPSLVWFGRQYTPNQHAIAERFGILDRAFTNSQVSADGHNWTDAAFANDYVERFWPPNYGGRRKLYDFQSGKSPDVPHNGYLWDDARRAGITYRDYGEDVDVTGSPGASPNFQQGFMPGLEGHYDPAFMGWDLKTSDHTRFQEWNREFRQFVAHDDLPRLEIVYFPNDHTAATRPGYLTPRAYAAQNDWAVGELVDAVSHSKYWGSTAIFVLEDDSQNGPDHVSDQRSTMYVASPYAAGGVHHEHVTIAGVVHTIEILCGLGPMSIYDQTSLPLYAAFTTHPDLRPFDAVVPSVDMSAVNKPTDYGAKLSATFDFTHLGQVKPGDLNDIEAHDVGNVASLRYAGR
ncbi:MAG TPA: bifunctional YncE family protein/alkaline phosphatase family protein [Candidatus Limnocylindria bacterium]|nr:bifunctional YncE family protein/alkaline phosphatase family protein [Candidatus Limnocylindria bacterium]